MSTTSGNIPIIPVHFSPDIIEAMTGEKKRAANKPELLPEPIKTKHGWYDCVLGSNCEEVCDHKTKNEAIAHAKKILEHLNKPCKECGDGTLVCNCQLLYHKLPKRRLINNRWVNDD